MIHLDSLSNSTAKLEVKYKLNTTTNDSSAHRLMVYPHSCAIEANGTRRLLAHISPFVRVAAFRYARRIGKNWSFIIIIIAIIITIIIINIHMKLIGEK